VTNGLTSIQPSTQAMEVGSMRSRRYNFGTTEREKNGVLILKRHQMKHLEF